MLWICLEFDPSGGVNLSTQRNLKHGVMIFILFLFLFLFFIEFIRILFLLILDKLLIRQSSYGLELDMPQYNGGVALNHVYGLFHFKNQLHFATYENESSKSRIVVSPFL